MKNITILFIFISISSFAQTPGYLGKRFSIDGSFNVLPRATEFILGNKSRPALEYQSAFQNNGYYSSQEHYVETSQSNSAYQPISLNLKTSLSLNFVLSRKIEASFRLTYLKNSIVLQNSNNRNRFQETSKYYKNNKSMFITTAKDDIAYKALVYDLNFKIYKKGFIAPVGKYFLMGLGVSKISSIQNNFAITTHITDNEYDDNGNAGPEYDGSYWNYDHDAYLENLSKAPKIEKRNVSNNNFTMVKFNLGFGRKQVFKNNTYLLYEVEMNFYNFRKNRHKTSSTNNDFYSSGQIETEESFTKSINMLFERAVREHIALDNLLNLKIGIGIIL